MLVAFPVCKFVFSFSVVRRFNITEILANTFYGLNLLCLYVARHGHFH